MSLTPVEIRHLELRRAFLRGYSRADVDRLLNEIADSFEEVWRERADLADRLDELEAEAAKHHELEALLRSTLVSAERASQDMKEQARRESDLIVQEAHAEGRRVAREAAAEKRRLEQDLREELEHRVVRLPALTRRRYAYLPRLAMAADDSRTAGFGTDAQAQAGARAFHGPKDIRELRPNRRPCGCRCP